MESLLNLKQLLIFANLGLLVILLIPLVIFARRFRTLSHLLEELHRRIPAESGELRVQVWISSDRERLRYWKMTPSREVGILVLGSELITLHSVNLDGERFTRRFKRSGLRPEWLGNQFMRDSNLQWFAISSAETRIIISAYTGAVALPSRRQTAEIYRNIAGQHEQFSGTQEFALEKNPASLAILVLLASMLIYAVADGIFINPREIVGYPQHKSLLLPLVLSLFTIFAATVYSFMIRFSVPARETLVLTMLSVFTLAGVAFPLGQRIDTALASGPAQSHDYRMVKEGIFTPVENGLPRLDMRLRCDYWKQYAADHRFQFMLQQGGLGLWQYDGRALDRDIETYMKKNPRQGK
jgi:hypothetical protein